MPAPVIVQESARILLDINSTGIAVVQVEQAAELTLELAHYGYVLVTDTIAFEGDAGSLMDNEHVRRAYSILTALY